MCNHQRVSFKVRMSTSHVAGCINVLLLSPIKGEYLHTGTPIMSQVRKLASMIAWKQDEQYLRKWASRISFICLLRSRISCVAEHKINSQVIHQREIHTPVEANLKPPSSTSSKSFNHLPY